jgi:hypothetical protein
MIIIFKRKAKQPAMKKRLPSMVITSVIPHLQEAEARR